MSLAACAPATTGGGFLKSTLVYLDCAGKAVGSAGYVAFSQPGSIVVQLILTAITLFIAWHGLRMMFGRVLDMGDAVLAVAKIGIVLMLVTSWPAVRTLFAEPTFSGPAELAALTRLEGPVPLEDRLQRADDGIVALTKWGTGKLDIRAGRTADGQPAASEFAGVALTDGLALGLGRLSFLVGSLMSLGLLRLLSGVMISALPIFAGLLLFDATRGLFLGWLRLIFALFVASLAIPLILTVELSLLEPWLARAIEQRGAFYATPSTPTELLAISASFLLILIGSMALLVRSCFAVDVVGFATRVGRWRQKEPVMAELRYHAPESFVGAGLSGAPSRAAQLASKLDRLDRSPQPSPIHGGIIIGRDADNDARPATNGRQSAVTRRRAKQRMALSHVRRNQS
jgi:type IV secretion system protein VirB6